MNVVANLLPAVAEHDIWPADGRALHKIGEKTMELHPGMIGTGETTAAKTHRLHAEITPIFLDQHVGGNFGSPKEAVHRLVNAHRLVDAVPAIGMIFWQLPARLLLDQRQPIGGVTVNFVGAGENEARIGAKLPRRLQEIECRSSVKEALQKPAAMTVV